MLWDTMDVVMKTHTRHVKEMIIFAGVVRCVLNMVTAVVISMRLDVLNVRTISTYTIHAHTILHF